MNITDQGLEGFGSAMKLGLKNLQEIKLNFGW